MQYRYVLTAACVGSLALAALSCSSSDGIAADSVDATDEAGQDGTDGASAEPDTLGDQRDEPLTCDAAARGYVATTVADIVYNGQAADIDIQYQATGCAAGLSLQLSIDGGCRLSIEADGSTGAWELVNASFRGDSSCSASWPAEYVGDFTARLDESTAAISAAPANLGNTSCVDGDIELAGRLRFDRAGTETTFDLFLNGLSVSGLLATTEITGSCPTPPTECAAGETCGRDTWGYKCGECQAGERCTAGTCELDGCPDLEPRGTDQGTYLTDLVVYECDDGEVRLHDMCGNPAGMFYLLAGW